MTARFCGVWVLILNKRGLNLNPDLWLCLLSGRRVSSFLSSGILRELSLLTQMGKCAVRSDFIVT